jgi:integrase
MGHLTDAAIRSMIRTSEPAAKADGDGLTITVSAAGTVAWVLRYYFAGRRRELAIGRYPDIGLAAARRLASEARGRIQQGIDVARAKQADKVRAAGAMTVRELVADYSSKVLAGLAMNTIKQRTYHIDTHILPRLGALPVRDVTPDDAVALIAAVGVQRTPHVAADVLITLSAIFKHGTARRVVTTSPTTGIVASAICGQPKPTRERLMLTTDELRVLLPVLPTIGMENALATKIILATCVRIGELARAEWAHVDLDAALWAIPDVNSKTRKGFVIPLPELAVDCFRQLEPLACGSRYVLPARRVGRHAAHGGDTHFECRTLNAVLLKLVDRLEGKVRRFSPHDLRSTARSHLGQLGVDLLVAERCLNHSLGGLVAVYDRGDYLEERRKALELWARFLEGCEKGADWNVIPLATATKKG